MLQFYSSGGCGDSLLVCNKLIKIHQDSGKNIQLHWFEKHQCHKPGILSIFSCFKFISGTCEVTENAQKIAMEAAQKCGGTYVDTKVFDSAIKISPKMSPIKEVSISPINERYICIAFASGRMGDNTKRVVDPKVFQAIRQYLPQHKIVLIGPEYIELDEKILPDEYNKTGRTRTVADAFGYINQADGFVGHDGVFAYYALMIGKPTIINWHMPTLTSHYWHPEWSDHCVPIFQGNEIRWLTGLELPAFSSMIGRK